MTASLAYLRHHGPMLRQFARIALAALRPGRRTGQRPRLPGEVVRRTVPPLPRQLIEDFVLFLGGDPEPYGDTLPPALFPQWAMPLMARTLLGLPYVVPRIVNAGATMEMAASLPRHEPLDVSARLLEIDENERRVIFTYEAITGTRTTPEALRSTIRALIRHPTPPLAKKNDSERTRTRRHDHLVPYASEPLFTRDFGGGAGGAFALITGDVNPVHWLPPYARAFGYKKPILHGFATFAFAVQAVINGRLGGNVSRLRSASMRFTNPLVLPATATVYGTPGGSEIHVGLAPGAPAVAVGAVEATRATGDPDPDNVKVAGASSQRI